MRLTPRYSWRTAEVGKEDREKLREKRVGLRRDEEEVAIVWWRREAKRREQEKQRG